MVHLSSLLCVVALIPAACQIVFPDAPASQIEIGTFERRPGGFDRMQHERPSATPAPDCMDTGNRPCNRIIQDFRRIFRNICNVPAFVHDCCATCQEKNNNNHEPTTSTTTAPALNISSAFDSFSQKVWQGLRTNNNMGNFVCSPYSLNQLLATLSFGATLERKQEILHALQLGSSPPTDISALYRKVNTVHRNMPGLSVANGIWVSGRPARQFQTKVKSVFHTEFSNTISKKEINTWVAEKTEGKIPNLFDNEFSSNTQLVAVHAMYLTAKWNENYKFSSITREFTLSSGESITADMMTTVEEFERATLPNGSTAVRIPFSLPSSDSSNDMSNEGLSMIFILPKKLGSEIEFARLSEENEEEWKTGFRRVVLPKFRIATTVDLQDLVQNHLEVGIFNDDEPNFDRLLQNNTKKLHVSKLVQKVVVEVNENGVEAAAATAAEILNKSGSSIVTIFNRPFAFQIVDNHQKLELFRGYVENPTIAAH